jgi:hypothetical protein
MGIVNDAAPLGIVSLQLAGDLQTSVSIVESWGPQPRIHAAFQTGVDFLYLIVYSLCLGLGCVLVADALYRKYAALAFLCIYLSWMLLVAGLLDSVENWALIRLIQGSKCELWPLLARWCAVPKFIIVFVGGTLVITGGVFCMVIARLSGGVDSDA